jgi:hypothetical protein
MDRLVARLYGFDDMINEYGGVGGRRIDKENLRLRGNLFLFIHHKSHIISAEIARGP